MLPRRPTLLEIADTLKTLQGLEARLTQNLVSGYILIQSWTMQATLVGVHQPQEVPAAVVVHLLAVSAQQDWLEVVKGVAQALGVLRRQGRRAQPSDAELA